MFVDFGNSDSGGLDPSMRKSRRLDPRRAYYTEAQPAILAIGTAVPPYERKQSEIGEWMAASFADRPALARLIQSMHAFSGIETRYSCIPDYALPAQESTYAPGQSIDKTPTTAERMAIFAKEAPIVGETAARHVLEEIAHKYGISFAEAASTITHLVVVTCTGFCAPGVDFLLAQALGLSPTANRTMIGFMGCAAMFNALQMASQAVKADPAARVLVVSVELCSLHSQPDESRDLLVAASIFGDGASACVVGLPTEEIGDYFELEEFYSAIKPETSGEMVWTIGDHGFQLHLSPRIPEHLAEAAPQSLHHLFDKERPEFWAIHPGGRAIVDRLAEIFGLEAEETAASREVLRAVGNLSSATILFVLDELRQRLAEQGGAPRSKGVAMAFGPGLVIEMARLTFVPAQLGHARAIVYEHKAQALYR